MLWNEKTLWPGEYLEIIYCISWLEWELVQKVEGT